MSGGTLQAELRFPLDEAEVEAYHRDGVVGPFRLVAPDVMASMRERVVDEIIVAGEPLDDPHVEYHDRHLDHETVCRLCRAPELVDRVASLIGPDLLIWRSNFQIKQPLAEAAGDEKRYTEVPWHQDGAYFDLRPPVWVSAWIAITEATLDNGCLQVVRGSHTSTFDHDIDDTRTSFHQAVPTDAIDPADIRAFELEPGEFVLFSENALHGSGPNRTDHPRIGLSPRVMPPFVQVTGNPLYAGLDRARHAPDEPRQMGLLRGHDYTGRHHLVPLPCASP